VKGGGEKGVAPCETAVPEKLYGGGGGGGRGGRGGSTGEGSLSRLLT